MECCVQRKVRRLVSLDFTLYSGEVKCKKTEKVERGQVVWEFKSQKEDFQFEPGGKRKTLLLRKKCKKPQEIMSLRTYTFPCPITIQRAAGKRYGSSCPIWQLGLRRISYICGSRPGEQTTNDFLLFISSPVHFSKTNLSQRSCSYRYWYLLPQSPSPKICTKVYSLVFFCLPSVLFSVLSL